jgi:hypothetical protein
MPERTATTEERIEARSGVDLTTLIVAALAAAIAALVTSRLWHGGTLLSTAMTPVIVALVKEYLDRPVRKVGQVARAPLQTVREPNAFRTVSVPAGGRGSERPAATVEPLEPADEAQWTSPPDNDGAPETPYRVYRRRPSVRAWWKVGLITGIAAFVVAGAALTLPELVGGTSVTGSGRTTLFHGSSSSSSGEPSGDDETTGTDGTTSSPSSQDEQDPAPTQRTTESPSATPTTRSAPESENSTPTKSAPSSGTSTPAPQQAPGATKP